MYVCMYVCMYVRPIKILSVCMYVCLSHSLEEEEPGGRARDVEDYATELLQILLHIRLRTLQGMNHTYIHTYVYSCITL
jgi:hypothetical protein